MKSFLIFSLLVFHFSLLFAQHDSGKATFHVVSANDKHYELSFAEDCPGLHKKITVDEKGNGNLYWGGRRNYNSSSFTADSVTVDSIRNLITIALVNEVNSYCLNKSCPKTACNYIISIAGKSNVYGAMIDVDFAVKGKLGFDDLDKVIKLLDRLYNRYAFPK